MASTLRKAGLVAGLLAYGAIFGAWLMTPVPSSAQEAVQTRPLQETTTPAGGTITTGGTFQTALAANSNRHGCLLENTSTHTMYVYAGATASATTAASVQVAAGGTFNCTIGGVVIVDNLAISSSTTGDTFVVWAQ